MPVTLTDEEFKKIDDELKALRAADKDVNDPLVLRTALDSALGSAVEGATKSLRTELDALKEAMDVSERTRKEDQAPEEPTFDSAVATWAHKNIELVTGTRQVAGDVMSQRAAIITAAIADKTFTDVGAQ